ncbi:PDZ domain-containing protein [Balneolaceae bacterium YR4-1]|uniref:PDZ domain-containing protein n=1 Tax=Halalkalibaculum roseum TaxID=2709311 RepID=A0A6M1SXF8_9BACT|nr:S41 family peptidase [Halalkalibaculum roseum]NGP76938.1 PDZ domain-containing protein [Halalkalibaculum roseum]
MSFKKFLAPNAAILILLSVFWFAGVDTIVKSHGSDRENIQKYIQTQRRIIDNYVDKVDISELYKSSIKGLVKNLKDSTAMLEGTPADTAFGEVTISSLSESVKRFEDAYLYLANNYPNENMYERTEDALRGMFKSLDPHSVYIEPEQSEDIERNFEGKFQGIGIQFNIIQDTITVITPISGGPSDQLGIRSGDRIIAINDSSAIGFENEDVQDALLGPKGSKVDVTIKRPKVKDPIEFTITRDIIPIYTVDTSYMLDDKTGYIKINRFAATTHEEFMEAMQQMKDIGMEQIVLDLRSNPGGYLAQAVAIAEEFFPRGTKLVSTKSRHTRFTNSYYSRRDGEYKEEPVIVLIDEGSASASEIVSGAIQDHDRGLIVGRRSFGKGLVQQQYGLVDSSKIRVTISKYYTPSGRLIQKPYSKEGSESYAYEIYERNDDPNGDVKEFIDHVPDSLRYYTDAGRTVYGGGGVVPDKIVQPDTSQSALVVNFMMREQIAFNFVRNYLDNYDEEFRSKWEGDFEQFRKDFTWDEKDKQEIYAMFKDHNMVVADTLTDPTFRNDSLFVPKGHYEEIEWMPLGYAKASLARQVWGQKQFYPVFQDIFDNVLEKVGSFWDEVHALEEYAANHQKPVMEGKD